MRVVPPADHPFCLDVRMNPYEPGRYVWTIKRQLRPPHNSTTSYASFDEARRVAKVEMDDLIADWRAGP